MARSPLYDIYDPYGALQQQAELGILPGSYGGARDIRLSDLMPEEQQQGMLHTLANAGASGLGSLGWLLDTPGAVVRGTLSGGPLKGLSALWETSDDRVTGRELLRQYGLAGDEDSWGNFGGGLAAELLLDPLTYASFGLNSLIGKGAKTAAGAAAGKAGMLADFDLYAKSIGKGPRVAYRETSISDLLNNLSDVRAPSTPASPRAAAIDRLKRASPSLRSDAAFDALRAADGPNVLTGTDALAYSILNEPLAATNRVGLPFTAGRGVDLYGKQVGDSIAKYGDLLAEKAMTNPVTGPIARGAVRAFDRDVKDFTDYDRQWEARAMSAAERRAESDMRRRIAGLQFDADVDLRKVGLSLADSGLSQQLREYLELGADAIRPEYRDALSLPAVKALTDTFMAFRANAVHRANKLGIPLNEFVSRSGVDFVPRQQLLFDRPKQPRWPEGVTARQREVSPNGRGTTPAPIADNYGRSREQYVDVYGGARTVNRMSMDAALQESLRTADMADAQRIMSEWEASNLGGGRRLYDWIRERNPDQSYKWKVPALDDADPLMQARAKASRELDTLDAIGDTAGFTSKQKELEALDQQIATQSRAAHETKLYGQMADLLRSLDPQHAGNAQPFFGQNVVNELSRYMLGRSRVESNASQMLDLLKKNRQLVNKDEVAGGVNMSARDALRRLGFTNETAESVLAKSLGVNTLDDVSFNSKFIDDWSKRIETGAAPPQLSPVLKAADRFTKSFKTLALLYPSRYTRDLYSGSFAAASHGAYSLLDQLAAYNPFTGKGIRSGDYTALKSRLAKAPGYEQLSPDERVRKFLTEAAAAGLGTSTYADEITSAATGSKLREAYAGQSQPKWSDIGKRIYNKDRGWKDAARDLLNPFQIRTASGNRNPLLELGDRAAESTDAMNRLGSYLTLVRKGYDPVEAKRITDLTQVNYGNATNFENRFIKPLIPFYSYTRGIVPYIADQLVNRPAGALGFSTRVINRAGEPSGDTFIPDYLRQTAAIPIGADEDGNLRRFLTNIDLPFESTINLFTPGTGNSLYEKTADSIRRTAQNVAGQLNPLVKGPLEQLTNRQFYSGRELSDLYSTLEQTLGPPGRAIEQIAYNLPGGSRAIGAYRQLTDQRLDPLDRYLKFGFNALTGLKLQDVDMERTRRLAARNMLNQMLESTPGVRTYENITVPDEVLMQMPQQQKDLYLLYKIIQSEASRQSRERKAAEPQDPLAILGVQ